MTVDVTRTDDPSRHRYRFWVMFRDFLLENRFGLPGSIPSDAADVLARELWRESVRRMVGEASPALLQQKRNAFNNVMADHACENYSVKVLRPGEEGDL